MSFDVFVIESSDSPDELDAAIEAAMTTGGAVTRDGWITTADGFGFEHYGSMFALRGWADSMGELLFVIAERTHSFILPVGEDSVAFRTPGNKGAPPDGLEDTVDIVDVKDAADLSRGISPAFYGWASFRDYALKHINPEG